MPLRLPTLVVAAILAAAPALAQDATPPQADPAAPASPAPDGANSATAPSGSIAVELNALRQVGDGCQAYFVVRADGAAVSSLQLDAFLFDPAGVIADRLLLTLPSVAAGKMKVMVFDLGLGCAGVARMFVNEILACEADDGPCAGRVTFSSRAAVGLSD